MLLKAELQWAIDFVEDLTVTNSYIVYMFVYTYVLRYILSFAILYKYLLLLSDLLISHSLAVCFVYIILISYISIIRIVFTA